MLHVQSLTLDWSKTREPDQLVSFNAGSLDLVKSSLLNEPTTNALVESNIMNLKRTRHNRNNDSNLKLFRVSPETRNTPGRVAIFLHREKHSQVPMSLLVENMHPLYRNVPSLLLQ